MDRTAGTRLDDIGGILPNVRHICGLKRNDVDRTRSECNALHYTSSVCLRHFFCWRSSWIGLSFDENDV